MTLHAPLWLQNATYDAAATRLLTGALAAPGVTSVTDLRVTAQSPAAMAVDVAAGTVIIDGTASPGQGQYVCRSDAVESVSISPESTGQSRIDLVVARVYDSAVTGSTDEWTIEVVSGAATSGTPVAPAVPASAFPLAAVTVTGATTGIDSSAITERRVAGGPRMPRLVFGTGMLPPAEDGLLATDALGIIWQSVAGQWQWANQQPTVKTTKAASTTTATYGFGGAAWVDVPGASVTIPAPGWSVRAVAEWSGPTQAVATTLVRIALRQGTGAWDETAAANEADNITGSPYLPGTCNASAIYAGSLSVSAKLQVFGQTLSNIKAGRLTLVLHPT